MGDCLRRLDELASVQNLIVESAFEALEARLRAELQGCPCREHALKAVEEYRQYAEQATEILVFMKPRRFEVLRWVLMALGLAAGVAVGFILAL